MSNRINRKDTMPKHSIVTVNKSKKRIEVIKAAKKKKKKVSWRNNNLSDHWLHQKQSNGIFKVMKEKNPEA